MPFAESSQLDMMNCILFNEFCCLGEMLDARIPLKPYGKEPIENIQFSAVIEGPEPFANEDLAMESKCPFMEKATHEPRSYPALVNTGFDCQPHGDPPLQKYCMLKEIL
jgi:hypothetical protein